MRGRWLLLSAVVLPMALFCGAWTPQWAVATLAGTAFDEHVRSDAPVVGGDIMGVLVGPKDWRALGRRLLVRSPGPQVSTVCFQAASVDGSYVAFNSYTFKPQAEGAYVEIPIEAAHPMGTIYPQRFSAASAQTMALLAREGRCDALATRLLPLRWADGGTSEGDSLQVTIAVQSGRSSVYLKIGDSQYPDTPCIPVQGERGTAFDTLCQVTVNIQRSQSLQLHLRRCAFDDCVEAPVETLDL